MQIVDLVNFLTDQSFPAKSMLHDFVGNDWSTQQLQGELFA